MQKGGQTKSGHWYNTGNGRFRFTSEAATWIQNQKWFLKWYLLGLLEKALGIIIFQGGDDGRGYRDACEIPQGTNLKKCHWYYIRSLRFKINSFPFLGQSGIVLLCRNFLHENGTWVWCNILRRVTWTSHPH